MLYGNLNKEEGQKVAQLFEQKMNYTPYPPQQHFHKAVSTLGDKNPSYFVKKSKHPANVVILYLDAGDFSFQNQAALNILAKSLEEPFFSELRTKQQTGYVVSSWSDEIERRLFAFFLTQSSSHDPRDLIARFELFFESSLTHLEATAIPEARFESVRSSLIMSLEHPPENMEKMGTLLHELAFDYEGDFAWREKEIAALKNLTYDQFKEFAFSFLGKDNKKRLAVCIEGSIPERSVLSYRKLNSFQKLKDQITYREKTPKNIQ
jgi:insulysin